MTPPPDGAMAREASSLSRYLVGEEASPVLAARYAAAVARLCPAESAALRAARARPSRLPYLDAGCALLRPADPLRQRVLVMAAVLEASPDHVDRFLPRDPGRAVLLLQLAAVGLRAVWHSLLGALIVARLPRP